MKYTYAYKTSDGVRHKAAMKADSREAVFAALREKGIKAINVVAADRSKANGEVRGISGFLYLRPCLVAVLKSLPAWSNVIIAITAIVGLWQTTVSLQKTSEVNAKTIAYYDAQMAPRFSILHDCPPAATNDYCHKRIVRDIRVVNQGVPVSAVNAAFVRTVLYFAVFDKRPTSGKSHASRPICQYMYYKDVLYPFLTDGLLLKGEVAPIQYEIAAAVRDYRNKHPDRFCEVIPRDFVDITYRDDRDVQHTVWLLDGARSNSEEYEKIKNLSKEFTKSLIEDGKTTSWEAILDACYEESKRESDD